jgi:biopolymer transport protein TolR
MEVGDSKSLKSDINVTPLVDVMLVMLIIFMLVTPLLQSGVGVTLPKAKNVAAVPDDESQVVVVALRANGETFLGKEVIDRTKLVTALRQRLRTNPGLQMQIKADKNVRFGEVKKIVQAGREAGFDGAALIAEEEKEPASTGQGG